MSGDDGMTTRSAAKVEEERRDQFFEDADRLGRKAPGRRFVEAMRLVKKLPVSNCL